MISFSTRIIRIRIHRRITLTPVLFVLHLILSIRMDSNYPSQIVMVSSLALGFVSLILQIVGLSTRGWVVTYLKTAQFKSEFSIGLWNAKWCFNDDCQSMSTNKLLDDFETDTVAARDDIDEYRAETIVGVITIFGAGVCLVILAVRKINVSRVTMLLICIGVLSGLSAILTLTAAGRFGRKLQKSHDSLGDLSPYLAPYSVYLVGVGGILAAFVFFIAVILACMRQGINSVPDRTRHQDRYAMEGVHNSATHPYHVDKRGPYQPSVAGYPAHQPGHDTGYYVTGHASVPPQYHQVYVSKVSSGRRF